MPKFPKFIKSKKFIAFVVILIIGFLLIRSRSSSPVEVQTESVQRGEVISDLILSGVVDAGDRAKLIFQTSGKIALINVVEGQRVKKGQLLGKLDTVKLNSDFMRAQWDLRDAQATVDRVHNDLKDKGNSESFTEKETRTSAEVAKDKAYENYVKAQKDLQDAIFISPVDGIVSQVGVSVVGATVSAGSIAFEVINPDTIYFKVKADQSEILQVKEGSEVIIELDSFDESINAQIMRVGLTPDVTESETLYKVNVSFTPSVDIKSQIRIGMTGDARFVLDRKTDVLYIDSSFLRSDKDGKYVMKGKEKVYVTTGIEGEDRVEIMSGLNEGDVIYK